MDDMDEAAAGDHGEAVMDTVEAAMAAGVFWACSAVLAAAKLGGDLMREAGEPDADAL